MSERQFTTPQPIRVELTVAAGDFEIATTDGDQSTVSLDGPQRFLDAIRVELLGDRLIIQQRRKPRLSFSGFGADPLHVQARVPHGSSVKITTASGDATLEGTFAGLETRSASGDLRVLGDVGGDAIAKTVSGNVRLPVLEGDLTVHTVSGEVEADSVEGSVSVRSVSGDVRVGSLREGKLNVQSVSGDVDLGIASGTVVDVDAASASGDLSSEVPLSDTPGGDSGPKLVIRGNTVSGDFRLRRAA